MCLVTSKLMPTHVSKRVGLVGQSLAAKNPNITIISDAKTLNGIKKLGNFIYLQK